VVEANIQEIAVEVLVVPELVELDMHSGWVPLVRGKAAIGIRPVFAPEFATVVVADNLGQVEKESEIRWVLATGGTSQGTGRIQDLVAGLGTVAESTRGQDTAQTRDRHHTQVVVRSQD
jgi:hypothetical protein